MHVRPHLDSCDIFYHIPITPNEIGSSQLGLLRYILPYPHHPKWDWFVSTWTLAIYFTISPSPQMRLVRLNLDSCDIFYHIPITPNEIGSSQLGLLRYILPYPHHPKWDWFVSTWTLAIYFTISPSPQMRLVRLNLDSCDIFYHIPITPNEIGSSQLGLLRYILPYPHHPKWDWFVSTWTLAIYFTISPSPQMRLVRLNLDSCDIFYHIPITPNEIGSSQLGLLRYILPYPHHPKWDWFVSTWTLAIYFTISPSPQMRLVRLNLDSCDIFYHIPITPNEIGSSQLGLLRYILPYPHHPKWDWFVSTWTLAIYFTISPSPQMRLVRLNLDSCDIFYHIPITPNEIGSSQLGLLRYILPYPHHPKWDWFVSTWTLAIYFTISPSPQMRLVRLNLDSCDIFYHIPITPNEIGSSQLGLLRYILPYPHHPKWDWFVSTWTLAIYFTISPSPQMRLVRLNLDSCDIFYHIPITPNEIGSSQLGLLRYILPYPHHPKWDWFVSTWTLAIYFTISPSPQMRLVRLNLDSCDIFYHIPITPNEIGSSQLGLLRYILPYPHHPKWDWFVSTWTLAIYFTISPSPQMRLVRLNLDSCDIFYHIPITPNEIGSSQLGLLRYILPYPHHPKWDWFVSTWTLAIYFTISPSPQMRLVRLNLDSCDIFYHIPITPNEIGSSQLGLLRYILPYPHHPKWDWFVSTWTLAIYFTISPSPQMRLVRLNLDSCDIFYHIPITPNEIGSSQLGLLRYILPYPHHPKWDWFVSTWTLAIYFTISPSPQMRLVRLNLDSCDIFYHIPITPNEIGSSQLGLLRYILPYPHHPKWDWFVSTWTLAIYFTISPSPQMRLVRLNLDSCDIFYHIPITPNEIGSSQLGLLRYILPYPHHPKWDWFVSTWTLAIYFTISPSPQMRLVRLNLDSCDIFYHIPITPNEIGSSQLGLLRYILPYPHHPKWDWFVSTWTLAIYFTISPSPQMRLVRLNLDSCDIFYHIPITPNEIGSSQLGLLRYILPYPHHPKWDWFVSTWTLAIYFTISPSPQMRLVRLNLDSCDIFYHIPITPNEIGSSQLGLLRYILPYPHHPKWDWFVSTWTLAIYFTISPSPQMRLVRLNLDSCDIFYHIPITPNEIGSSQLGLLRYILPYPHHPKWDWFVSTWTLAIYFTISPSPQMRLVRLNLDSCDIFYHIPITPNEIGSSQLGLLRYILPYPHHPKWDWFVSTWTLAIYFTISPSPQMRLVRLNLDSCDIFYHIPITPNEIGSSQLGLLRYILPYPHHPKWDWFVSTWTLAIYFTISPSSQMRLIRLNLDSCDIFYHIPIIPNEIGSSQLGLLRYILPYPHHPKWDWFVSTWTLAIYFTISPSPQMRLVRLNLDSCDIFYHIPITPNEIGSSQSLNYQMTDLERTQYKAALAVSGAWEGTSVNKLYEGVGWETLTHRRLVRRLTQFYNIMNNLTPEYLKSSIPFLKPYLFGYRSTNVLHTTTSGTMSNNRMLRQLLQDRRRFHRLSLLYKIVNHLTPDYLQYIPNSVRKLLATRMNRDEVFSTRTLKFRHSFFPDTLNSWNNLRSFIKRSPPLNIFKKRYIVFLNVTPNPIYVIHDPIGLKCLTRRP